MTTVHFPTASMQIRNEIICQIYGLPGKAVQALLAFSLMKNFPSVTSANTGSRGYLAMNGLRFFSMVWIVLGHTWATGNTFFASQYHHVIRPTKLSPKTETCKHFATCFI